MTGPVVEADPSRGGGYALIRIPRGAGGLADPRIRLSREGHEASVLGPGGWQVADTLITPLAVRADGDALVLAVGPAVVDTIESGVVVLAVPSTGFDEPIFWPDLPLSAGSQGVATFVVPAPARAQPKPIEVQHKIEPPPPSPPPLMALPLTPLTVPSPTNVKGRPRWLFPVLAIGLVLLALGAGGIWWVMHLPQTQNAVTQAAPALSPVPVPPRDCATGSIQDIVGCAPDPDALYHLAEKRWDSGQVNDGLVLMQIAAERGSGAAALRLAQLYDPATFQPGGPIPHFSTREAAKYYRRAAQSHQDGVDAPRQTLRRRLQGDADAGDTLADLTLKDFWP